MTDPSQDPKQGEIGRNLDSLLGMEMWGIIMALSCSPLESTKIKRLTEPSQSKGLRSSFGRDASPPSQVIFSNATPQNNRVQQRLIGNSAGGELWSGERSQTSFLPYSTGMAENIYSKGTRVWFEDKDLAWISAEVSSVTKGPDDAIKLVFVDERGKVN